MIYTEKITLEQALDLANGSNIAIYCNEGLYYTATIEDDFIKSIYEKGNCFYLTRSDFAIYIIGNKPLPDGWGYPSKELSSGIYQDIPFITTDRKRWIAHDFNFGIYCTGKWYDYAFRLTDITRVEAEPEINFAELNKTLAGKVEMLKNCTDARVEAEAVEKEPDYMPIVRYVKSQMLSNNKSVEAEADKPSIPAFDLKSIAGKIEISDEELADFNQGEQESKSEYWKAKYSELEKQSEQYKSDLEAAVMLNKTLSDNAIAKINEATVLADSLQDRLTYAQNCITAMEAKYNEIVKAANFAIDRLQIEHQMFGSYADAKYKSEIAVYKFDNLLNN